MNFAKFPDAVEKGAEAARKSSETLRKLSVSEAEYAAFLVRQRVKREEPRVDAVRIESVSGVDPRTLAHRVKSKPGTIDWRTLERDLARLYEIGDYESVDFRIASEEGKQVLVFSGRPRRPAPSRMRFGLKLDTDFASDSSFGAPAGSKTSHEMPSLHGGVVSEPSYTRYFDFCGTNADTSIFTRSAP